MFTIQVAQIIYSVERNKKEVIMVIRYYQCPYCTKYTGGHTKKAPNSIGKFRVKEIGDIVLVLQCLKCMQTHRVKKMGKPLLWDDMSYSEKRAFRSSEWVKKRRKLNEVKENDDT